MKRMNGSGKKTWALPIWIPLVWCVVTATGCNKGEDVPQVGGAEKSQTESIAAGVLPAAEGKQIRVRVRNAAFPLEDPGGQELARYYDLRERDVDLPLEQTALVLIDTWAVENKRYRNPVADIAHEIREVLDAARAVDMLVLYSPHRPIGWDGINHTAQDVDLRGPSDTPRSEVPDWVRERGVNEEQWPPVEFVFRVGEYAKYSRFSNPSYIPYTKILGIHPELLPRKRAREFIESSPREIQKIFRNHGILHLIYVGGATNQCIVQRPVGIRNMSARGYNTIVVRGATSATELSSTYASQEVNESAIRDIEINNGFSISKNDLVDALEAIKASL